MNLLGRPFQSQFQANLPTRTKERPQLVPSSVAGLSFANTKATAVHLDHVMLELDRGSAHS